MYHNIPRAIIICIRIRIPPVLLKPKQILICRQKYHFRLNLNKYKLQQAPGQNFACETLKGQDLEIEDLASQRYRSKILKQLEFQNFIFKILKIQQLEI